MCLGTRNKGNGGEQVPRNTVYWAGIDSQIPTCAEQPPSTGRVVTYLSRYVGLPWLPLREAGHETMGVEVPK